MTITVEYCVADVAQKETPMLVFVLYPDFEKVAAPRLEAYQYVIKYPHQENAYFVQMQPGEPVFRCPPQLVPDDTIVISWDVVDDGKKEWLRRHLGLDIIPEQGD